MINIIKIIILYCICIMAALLFGGGILEQNYHWIGLGGANLASALILHTTL